MYLKEAFRYQNFLENLIVSTKLNLSKCNITQTVEEHQRNKFNPDAEDEVIDVTAENRTTEYSADNLLEFLLHLAGEKEALARAISKTKRTCELDIDTEISNNKTIHDVAALLALIEEIKPSETKKRGTGYKINAEGNQVPYTYDIKEITTIDFNRNFVRSYKKKLMQRADEISLAIDKAMVETEVPYQSKYSVSDSYDDVMEIFLQNKASQ